MGFELSHVEISQALAGETGTKYEELVPSFLLRFGQNYGLPNCATGFVIHFDAHKPLAKIVKFVNFAICDKFVESATRLLQDSQKSSSSLIVLILSPAFKPGHKFFCHF